MRRKSAENGQKMGTENGDSHNFCLLNCDKVIYWEIIDPKEKGIHETRQIRNQISGLVEKLIAEIK